MFKKFLLILTTATILFTSAAAYAEKLPEDGYVNQIIRGVMVGETPDGTNYILDNDQNIIAGPFKTVTEYDGYPYAIRADGSQVMFDRDGSVIAETPECDSMLPPAHGIYAIMRGVSFGEDYNNCTSFEIYDQETREKLCTLDTYFLYYLDQQSDKMVIERDGKCAFINKYGELQSDYVYDEVKQRFNPPYEPYPQSYAIVVQDGVTKYIDRDLNEIDLDNYNGAPFITNYRYLSFYDYETDSDLYVIESGDKQGLCRGDAAEYLIPLQTEYKFHITNGTYVLVSKDGKSGITDLYGNVIIEPKYGELYFQNDKYLSFRRDEGEDNYIFGLIAIKNMNEVFTSNDYLAQPVTDGILAHNYIDYSDEYKAYRGEFINYAGHKLTNEKYVTVTYENGKFYATDSMMSEPHEISVPTDFAVIKLNGRYLDFDGVIRDNRTLVPMREIVEGLGGTVEWDGADMSVKVVIDGKEIDLTVNSDIMTVSGEAKTLDVPAQLINEKTMLPLRAVAEAVGAEVDWDPDIRCVYMDR